MQRIDSWLITEIHNNVGIVRSVDKLRRYVDRVVKNEICQNSDIAPKTSMSFFTRLKNYKKPHGRDAEKIEAFQTKPGIFGKED